VSRERHRFERAANARSIKHQMTIARLPLAKEVDEFDFDATPVNETLVRELAGGDFLEQQRDVVLIGGTGTGKSHLAVGITRACIQSGRRGRFFNAVDLVNKLDAEARADRQGRTADLLCRLDLSDMGLGPMAAPCRTPGRTGLSAVRPDRRAAALPLHQSPVRAHIRHRHHQPRLRRVAYRLRRRQDDDGAARPAHPPLRHRRDRQRRSF
jgi:hypothetical protein